MADNKPSENKTVKAVYKGSQSSLFDFAGKEYSLHNGEEYELPMDSPHVKSLIAQKLLVLPEEKK